MMYINIRNTNIMIFNFITDKSRLKKIPNEVSNLINNQFNKRINLLFRGKSCRVQIE